MKNIKRFIKDESGATAIEYGLLVALLSVAALASLGPLATAVNGAFAGGTTAFG